MVSQACSGLCFSGHLFLALALPAPRIQDSLPLGSAQGGGQHRGFPDSLLASLLCPRESALPRMRKVLPNPEDSAKESLLWWAILVVVAPLCWTILDRTPYSQTTGPLPTQCPCPHRDHALSLRAQEYSIHRAPACF